MAAGSHPMDEILPRLWKNGVDDRTFRNDRLMAACGSASPDFVNATLFQLQAAARLPNSGLSENAALALIESEQPKGETECAIVIQMACVHAATMAVLWPAWWW